MLLGNVLEIQDHMICHYVGCSHIWRSQTSNLKIQIPKTYLDIGKRRLMHRQPSTVPQMANRIGFKWVEGDMIFIDNTVVMHSRQPFEKYMGEGVSRVCLGAFDLLFSCVLA